MGFMDICAGLNRKDYCFRKESELSDEIIELMTVQKITPTIDDYLDRCQILVDLNKIVHEWVSKVAQNNDQLEGSAEVVSNGSFRQQAYLPSSDLDVVVIGPHFTSIDHFFGQLFEMIKCHPKISNIRCIEGANVPLIKLTMYDVAVDVAYARIEDLCVPKAKVLKDENFCVSRAIGEESLLSLQSLAVNYRIHTSLPYDGEILKQAIQFLKYWAKCRGIYGKLVCYFGGIHISVMVACICKAFRFSSLARVLETFFAIYSSWDWKNPIELDEDVKESACRPPMICIQNPGTSKYCHINVNSTTLKRISDELQIAATKTKELTCWSSILENYCHDLIHERFIKIYISVTDSTMLDRWIDFVKSRFVALTKILKKHANIDCDPNLTEYVEFTSLPMVSTSQHMESTNRVFLWGIMKDTDHGSYDLGSTVIFLKKDLLGRKQGTIGTIDLAVVSVESYQMYNDHCRVESKTPQTPKQNFFPGSGMSLCS